MRNIRFLLLILAALLVVSTGAYAQNVASVTGVVIDSSGAAVPGASIKLENSKTGTSFFGKTAGDGTYRIVDVPPGPGYVLTVKKDGFQTFVVNNLYLLTATPTTQDAKLELGALTQTVQVTAQGAGSLNTTDASISSTIEGDRVQDLPSLFVDNAASLMILAPGVQATGDDSQQGAITGTRGDQGNITLDGIDVNDQRTGQAFAPTVNTPLDSIQEVKLIVGGNDATFGRSAGGQTELVTKGGTNEFHGSAYDFNRVTAFAANDFFNDLNGIPKPPLVRNQFGGSIGGPILKNNLFFFFAYNGLREHSSQKITEIVPLDPVHFFAGQLNYVNTAGNVVPTPASGANSLPALDPQGTGADAALLSFIQSRYGPFPPNDFADGDLVNTAGFQFTAPAKSSDNTFTGRLDYQVTKNHRLFARGTWDRSNDDDDFNHLIEAFPGDPTPANSFIDHSRSWVVGDTWTISPNLVNQASVGETDSLFAFPNNFRPTFPNYFSFAPFLSSPYNNDGFQFVAQFPNVPVYQIRDSLNWTRGKHSLEFGGVIKPVIFKSGNLRDFNSYGIGLNSFESLDSSMRPSDLQNSALAHSLWDNAFAFTLGRYSGVNAEYNYDKAGNPLAQGTVPIRDFHGKEFELYAQDVWNVIPSLTVTYGLRWEYHSPLSEVNGFQVITDSTMNQIFGARQSAAAAGIEGPDAAPLISYMLGGPANHAPGYFKPQYTNFDPRIGIAYSPSFTEGFLGKVLGDRKTSIRTGFAINHDVSLIGTGFELDLSSFLFDSRFTQLNGDIATDPRFDGFHVGNQAALPPLPPAGTVSSPLQPNVDQFGIPIGFNTGGFPPFFNFDRNYKTPYEMSFSFGFQRQLPGNWLVDMTYFGKLGRRLSAVGDAAQTLNFKDATVGGPMPAGQFLYDAFGKLQQQVQAGTPVGSLTAQPWFENQVTTAIQIINPGLNCPIVSSILLGTALDCTNMTAAFAGTPIFIGDVSSTLLDLAVIGAQATGDPELGLVPLNSGLLAQTGADGYVSNLGSSNYNSLLIRVQHPTSHNLTLEFDYAYAHSIDNDSDVQNELANFTFNGAAVVCDLRNLRVCRGDSNFDARHTVAANFVYGLPFGRGQWLGHSSSRLVDELIGGWKVSGVILARTGFPFKIDTGSFPIDFTQTAPAVFVGKKSDIKGGIHTTVNGFGQTVVQFFANDANALNAFAFPFGGGTGNRNVVHGPGYVNTNLAILKNFTMPWSEAHVLQFRAEAFNLFNHPSFNSPAGNSILSSGNFGDISSTLSAARQVQLALKYTF